VASTRWNRVGMDAVKPPLSRHTRVSSASRSSMAVEVERAEQGQPEPSRDVKRVRPRTSRDSHDHRRCNSQLGKQQRR